MIYIEGLLSLVCLLYNLSMYKREGQDEAPNHAEFPCQEFKSQTRHIGVDKEEHVRAK